MALPARLGGLGIFDPSKKSALHYSTCETISAPLVRLILDQSEAYAPEVKEAQTRMRNNAQKFHRQCEARAANDLEENLPTKLQKALTICSEKGASSWLSALPISEHGFALHKGAFRDALCLRYGWRPSHLPSHCVCGHHFTIEHALSCSRGGFPSIRHNEIRNITADLLSGVCHGVGTEPSLQPVIRPFLAFTYLKQTSDDVQRSPSYVFRPFLTSTYLKQTTYHVFGNRSRHF